MMKLCSKGHLHMCYFYALALFRRGGGSGDFRLEAKYMYNPGEESKMERSFLSSQLLAKGKEKEQFQI